MILIGEGKIHADNLPDANYYKTHKGTICRTLFTETGYGIRFAPLVLETIKKSHKTLPYILRNQYTSANIVYFKLIEIPQELVIANGESKFCFALTKRMAACSELQAYYKDIQRFLIGPVFTKFGYYSPTMSFVVLIGLICFLGESYNNSYYGLVWKHFMKDCYPPTVIHEAIQQLDDMDREMIRDEMDTWAHAKMAR